MILVSCLTDKSSKIIHHSNIRPANILLNQNIYLDSLAIPRVVTSKRDLSHKDTLNTTKNDESFESSTNMHILNTSDYVGRTFLIPADEDG